jgi:MATE family multidrug resistance protein
MKHDSPDWRIEAPRLIRLATPIFIGQVAQIGMGVTDTIMAGHYSAQDLAAIAIGQSIWLPVYMFFIGLSTACTTQVAHHAGARNNTGAKHSAQQMLWLLWLLSPLGIVLVLQADRAFTAMGIDPSVSNITAEYLGYLCFGFPATISYLALRALSEGMRATRPIMLVNLASLLINIPLNYIFIYGKWGAPEMGAAGCGVASAMVMWIQLLGVIVVVAKLPQLKAIAVFKQWQLPSWPIISSQINLGLPVALSTMAEVALFSGVAMILAQLGANVVAGHQIALSISSITFMLPLSLGIAITIHSGQYLGAGQKKYARYTSRMGVIGGALIAVITMSIIILGRETITGLYTDDPEIRSIALALLLFAAVFQLPDAVQVCATSALRAYLDTRVPMLIILFSYWVISVPLGWSLTHGIGDFAPMGAEGMWIGLVCGLSCAAILQSWRLWWVLKQNL